MSEVTCLSSCSEGLAKRVYKDTEAGIGSFSPIKGQQPRLLNRMMLGVPDSVALMRPRDSVLSKMLPLSYAHEMIKWAEGYPLNNDWELGHTQHSAARLAEFN